MMDQRDAIRPDPKRLQSLMMAAVDQEISAEQQVELDAALAADPELRDEWEAFQRLKEVTDTMTPRKPSDEIWDGYWEGVYRRLERGFGWILASVGAIVLLVWGAWTWVRKILAATELPEFVRWSILALAAGLVVVFVSVARERFFVRRTDPYKDVVR